MAQQNSNQPGGYYAKFRLCALHVLSSRSNVAVRNSFYRARVLYMGHVWMAIYSSVFNFAVYMRCMLSSSFIRPWTHHIHMYNKVMRSIVIIAQQTAIKLKVTILCGYPQY